MSAPPHDEDPRNPRRRPSQPGQPRRSQPSRSSRSGRSGSWAKEGREAAGEFAEDAVGDIASSPRSGSTAGRSSDTSWGSGSGSTRGGGTDYTPSPGGGGIGGCLGDGCSGCDFNFLLLPVILFKVAYYHIKKVPWHERHNAKP